MAIETLLSVETEVTNVLNDLEIFEKLSEMDDFMNQNELKVEITNGNTVETGVVTYTCTVKDKNNNALPNKVVEWYEGTTLVGLNATDSNGVSTFSRQVTTASIFDVNAVVRGTSAGDDIRMYIKDKGNLLSYNIWSGGDLNKTIASSEYTHVSSISAQVSELNSAIGDYSIEVDYSGDGTSSGWFRLALNNFSESLVGKTITFSGQIYSPEPAPYLKIYLRHGSTAVAEEGLNLSQNSEFTPFTISAEITDATVDTIIFNFSTIHTFWLDNLVAKLE